MPIHLISRRHALGSAAALLASPAWSQSNSVRLVLPLAAGGSSDAVARALAKHMEGTLGRPVVVENRTGGQGSIGAAFVAGAPADGNTLLMAASSIVQNVALLKDIPNLLPRLRPVSQVIVSPNALAVTSKLGVNTLQEFVQLARQKPGALTVGTVSTLGQALCELLKTSAQIDFAHVPYRGESQALPDVIGGHIAGMIGSPGTLDQHVRAGALKLLAVSNKQRSAGTPQVPTFAEAGHPTITMTGWLGIFAPLDTPNDAVRRMEEAVMAAVRSDAVGEQIRQVGMEPAGTHAAAFQDIINRELVFWNNASKTLKL